MPRLSVIIAAFNAETTITKCLESVLSQQTDTELVVVNDGSTDGTKNVLAKYEGKAKIIHLKQNSGCVAKTRNVGLNAATGDYITFLDADDYYEEGALSKLCFYADEYGADIIRFNYTMVFPSGERKVPNVHVERFSLVQRKPQFKLHVYPKFIDGMSLNSVCLALFKRSVVKDIRFSEQYKTAEDAAFSIEAYTRAKTVLFVPDAFYCYYQTGGGLTGSGMGIIKKYKYNFMLSFDIIRHLKVWGMDTPKWRVRAFLRPIRLTIDKLKR